MTFLQGNVLGVALAGVPVAGCGVLHAELTAARRYIGFAVPNQVVAVAGHILPGPVVEGGPQLHVIGHFLQLVGIADTLVGKFAQRQGLRVGPQRQTVFAVFLHFNIGAGVKGILAAAHNGVGSLVCKMGSVNTGGVVPCIALPDDGDLEGVAGIQVYFDLEGVELPVHLLQQIIILGPDLAPCVIGVSPQSAGQHPGPVILHAGLPCHENRRVFGDWCRDIKGYHQRRSRIVALDHIALLLQLRHVHRLTVLCLHFFQHRDPVALIEGHLPGRIGSAFTAAGQDHGQNQQAGQQRSCQFLFHFVPS